MALKCENYHSKQLKPQINMFLREHFDYNLHSNLTGEANVHVYYKYGSVVNVKNHLFK